MISDIKKLCSDLGNIETGLLNSVFIHFFLKSLQQLFIWCLMGAGPSVVAEPIEVEVDAAPAPGELTSGRGVDIKQLQGVCPSQRKAICASVSRRSDLVVVSGNLPFRKSMWILKRKGTYWLEEGRSLCRQKSSLCSQRKHGGS